MLDKDHLFPFVFENTAMRGELVRLNASFQTALKHHDYPPPVRDLLGEAIVATVLLGATIKFDGSLNLQIQGSGPVKLLLVQLSSQRTFRGMAEWDPETDYAGDKWSLNELVGDGRLTITVEPENPGDRYQGIVDLCADTLSAVLENYFDRSEQLKTRLWLGASDATAAGLLIQLMPQKNDKSTHNQYQEESDDWQRVNHLSNTISMQELLHIPTKELLHRLYNEEDVRLFKAESLSFRCKCSKPSIENMLQSLGYQEVSEVLVKEKVVNVKCEFCKQNYQFDTVDIERLFSESISPVVPKTRH